jgi:hypothetical protein
MAAGSDLVHQVSGLLHGVISPALTREETRLSLNSTDEAQFPENISWGLSAEPESQAAITEAYSSYNNTTPEDTRWMG